MHARRIRRQRVAAIGRGGQRLEIDIHQHRRVLGEVAVIGYHNGDGFTHMHGLAAGECGTIQILLVARTGQPDHQLFGLQIRTNIVACEYRIYAGQGERRRLVDAAYRRMPMRAAHIGCVQHAGQLNVIHKAPLSSQQRVVFEALNTATDNLAQRWRKGHGSVARMRLAASSAASTMP